MEFKQSADLGPEAQMVTALPDVRAEPLRAGDEFLLIACDGIWDVMTSGQACDFVRAKAREASPPFPSSIIPSYNVVSNFETSGA